MPRVKSLSLRVENQRVVHTGPAARSAARMWLLCGFAGLALTLTGCIKQRHAIVPPPPEVNSGPTVLAPQ